jgi:histone demethylase JARID1
MTGKPVGKIPQLDKRPIDLYKLKNEVALRGGVQQVTRTKKWAEIGRDLGYARKQCTSMSNALKSVYQKIILPYEIWYAKHKHDAFDVGEGESDTCELCQKNENEEDLLLCDGCNRGYHMYCLRPPLHSVPKTDWYCLHCLTAIGKDYGFEDGDEYSLDDFFEFSEKFKKDWFHKLFDDHRPVSEEDCENEFWRLVENPHETCEVEYGADLHSTQHGSGFLAPEQMREFDPWNLNVIPVAYQSLFTHIKTDISGMMVPWLYIGMCFSAFCWHNEDHYTYSINYMHWGETKTWYGVPGSDTAKFEETMKKAVPELFEQQPDLLFQLVTMLSPGRLLKENVKVYAVDQRPGQFVVTFPKAYHSGFNHGVRKKMFVYFLY